jgi:hypothetical protein
MKTITIDNYEEYIIDFVDNTLSADLNQEMLTLLNLHPNVADEVLQFRNLKVTPDHTITFAGKADLMRPETPIKTPIWRRPLFIAASLMMISCVLGLCLYTSGDIHQEELVEVDSPVKFKPIEKSIEVEAATPAENNTEVIEAKPIAQTESTKQLQTKENRKIVRTSNQVIPAQQQMASDIQVDQAIADISNPVVTVPSDVVSQSTPVASKEVISTNGQIALIQDLSRLSLVELNSAVESESYIANLDMELLEMDKKIRFYASPNRRIISTLVTALIPSFASEEVLFLPENLNDIEIELLPTYIKNRKVKH